MSAHAQAHRIGAADLQTMVARIVRSWGASEGDAAIVAEHLVTANLRGHDSHGVGMMPTYGAGVKGGGIDPRARAERTIDAGALAVYDAHRSFGHVAARIVMDDAIERARAHGIALAGLKNSAHIARVGTYGERVAAAGLAGLILVNAVGRPPAVAPFGGAEARWSTNPMCLALPELPGRPPLILDFATSAIAIGKARVAANDGVPLAPGFLLDDRGEPTTDPHFALREPLGALLPFGLHKGSGLALMCDLMCGALLGGGTAQPAHPYLASMTNNMLAIVFDPAVLGDAATQRAETEAMVAYVKSARPRDPAAPVLVPGEVEAQATARRSRDGIDVDPVTWRALESFAAAIPAAANRS